MGVCHAYSGLYNVRLVQCSNCDSIDVDCMNDVHLSSIFANDLSVLLNVYALCKS